MSLPPLFDPISTAKVEDLDLRAEKAVHGGHCHAQTCSKRRVWLTLPRSFLWEIW